MATATATKVTIAWAASWLTCLSSRYRAIAAKSRKVACIRSATKPTRNSVADERMLLAVAAGSLESMMRERTDPAKVAHTNIIRYRTPATLASVLGELMI
jgi:hypothetical protein